MCKRLDAPDTHARARHHDDGERAPVAARAYDLDAAVVRLEDDVTNKDGRLGGGGFGKVAHASLLGRRPRALRAPPSISTVCRRAERPAARRSPTEAAPPSRRASGGSGPVDDAIARCHFAVMHGNEKPTGARAVRQRLAHAGAAGENAPWRGGGVPYVRARAAREGAA